MRMKILVLITLLALPIAGFSRGGLMEVSGFECADNHREALRWLGLEEGYPGNVVEHLRTELSNRWPDAAPYAIHCKSPPFHVARPYLDGHEVVAGKTKELSLSFSFSMAIRDSRDRYQTLHIDMTYTGGDDASGGTGSIGRRFSIVGNVNNKK